MKTGNIPGVQGKTFVVLGAGQGIGRATAQLFAEAGASIVCVDKELHLAEAVAAEVGGWALAADVTARQDMARLFPAAVECAGRPLDGLIDIVGIADVRTIADMDDAGWDGQFDIVLRHAFLALQYAPEHMPNGGSIAFVSSMAGARSVENQSVYGAAKAALDQLVRGAAGELGPRGIRVNAVSPGFVRTPRLDAALSAAFWDGLKSHVPVGRAADPVDIAGPLLFLCSDLAACVTGTVIPVDGGVSTRAALPPIPLRRKAEAVKP
ncbi:MAG: SDR family oxidoreductase [Sneathiellaceae bacterium]